MITHVVLTQFSLFDCTAAFCMHVLEKVRRTSKYDFFFFIDVIHMLCCRRVVYHVPQILISRYDMTGTRSSTRAKYLGNRTAEF